jgi:hypothetical protein
LFNPFFYVAGGKALSIGLTVILLSGFLGALGNTHFDGVLDTHTGAHVPLWIFLVEGMIDWFCMAAVLLALGAIVSKSSFRVLDVLGTQALARWPMVLVALLMLPDAVRRFSAQLVGLLLNAGAKPAINFVDAAIFCLVILASIPLVCWMVYLMYKSYSVSCNVKGGKAVGTFIGGLLAAEVLSKLCLSLLLSHALTGTASERLASSAPQAVESSNTQTNTQPGGLADSGVEFVNLLVKEEFAGAVARFDPTMTRVFPESQLRESWQGLVEKAGPFKKQLKVRTSEQQGYQIVRVTCQFEIATLDVKVVFDSKRQVAGLFYVPSDSK